MNKGMPLWEQHIEKIVLALTVVVLLAVFAMLVLGTNSITAEIDGRQYGPTEVDEVLVEKAQELSRKLGPNAEVDVSAFEAIKSGGLSDFQERLGSSVGPAGMPPRISPALAMSLMPEGVGSIDKWYYEPRIPAPVIRDRISQAIDTIDPAEMARVPELSSMLGGDSDVAWTTPVATLDLAAIRAELASSSMGSTPPREVIPQKWFNERPYILDVVFERQVQGRDGTWGEPEVVDSLPGGDGLRAYLLEQKANNTVDASLKESVWLGLNDRVKQMEILQPAFYATLNSSSALILEPEEEFEDAESGDGLVDDEDAAKRRQERELRRRIKDRRNSAGRLLAKIEDLGGPLEENDADRDDKKPGGSGSRGGSGRGDFEDTSGGGAGGAGFGNSGAGRKSGGSMSSQADRQKRISMTKRLRSMEADIERLERQLASLNPEAVIQDEETQLMVQVPDIVEEEEILVWAHDIGVVPGSTYRYRCRILLYNPFFAKGRSLLEEQRPLQESFEIASAASGWSKPITVAPPVEFFFIRANDDKGSMGLGEVRVELFRYEDGARRSQQFTLQPGERIGRAVNIDGETVDFETDWYLVDVISDPSATSGSGLDKEDDATVVCRRMDGSETRIRVPSRQRVDPQRTRLRVDADGASG